MMSCVQEYFIDIVLISDSKFNIMYIVLSTVISMSYCSTKEMKTLDCQSA